MHVTILLRLSSLIDSYHKRTHMTERVLQVTGLLFYVSFVRVLCFFIN